MSPMRILSLVLMGLGAVALAIAAVGTFTGDDDGVAAPTTTLAVTTTGPAVTTTVAATTTTAPPVTTTTVAETTTTTTPPLGPADVEAFVQDFAAAIASGDVEFLYSRLHPVVTGMFDEDLCRSFIEREILALVDYRVRGEILTDTRTFDVNGVSVIVDPIFITPVAFTFQGQGFEDTATFAEVNGEIRWFTQCR